MEKMGKTAMVLIIVSIALGLMTITVPFVKDTVDRRRNCKLLFNK